MKKLLLAFAVLFAGLNSASATHLMGGQITSRNIGGLTYEVTLTAYRDTVGIPMYTTAMITYQDSGSFLMTHTVPVSLPTSIGNGVEMYKYVDTITFPNTGNYDIWYEDCCRNCALLNMTSPCSESFHLNNSLWADSTNSSPEFLNIPITLAQLNTPFSYNPLPFDADGDSISWVLDIPLSTMGTPVLGYVLPFSDSLAPFTMDPATGEITFLPNTLGNFEVSVQVIEYRGGVAIGFIRRDMQIIVVPSANRPLQLSLTSGNAPYSGKNYAVAPGTAFNFTVVAEDPDLNTPFISAAGEAFGFANAPVFTTSSSNGSTTASLSWMPTQAQLRTNPYLFTLRTRDAFGQYTFSNDVTLRVHVDASAGISQPEANASLNVYPNPVSGSNLSISFTVTDASPVTIDFVNLAGQSAKKLDNVAQGQGMHVISVSDLNLSKGLYLVRLTQNGKQLGATKFTVQ